MKRQYTVRSRRKNIFSRMNVTILLIMVNVVLFILFSFLISSIFLSIDYVSIKTSNILDCKYLWTFITSMFMHGGLFHIFANMFSLIFIGTLVERILGPKRYLYFYLISGLIAGVVFVFLSLFFTADFNTFAVGASGALFGLIGLLMLLTPNLEVYLMFVPIPIKMKYAAPGILIVLWFISIAGNIPIGNTAHLGGLLTGLAYGIYLKKKYKRKTQYINKYFSR